MKLSALVLSAAVLLFSLVGSVQAGTLTIDNGPSFRPGSAFTDNDIEAVLLHNPGGVMGDVVRLYGDSYVAPAAPSPRIALGGELSANAGDLFSVIYDFTVDLKSPTPITLSLAAQTLIAGVKQTFDTLVTLTPGFQHYQGEIDGPLFDLATSGLWRGRLLFNFTAPDGSSENPDPEKLCLRLRAVDYQLVSIPEPSSLLFLGIGIAALSLFAIHRRRIA